MSPKVFYSACAAFAAAVLVISSMSFDKTPHAPRLPAEIQTKPENGKVPVVLLAPLDDRPVNGYFAKKIGEAGGMAVKMPPEALIGNFQTPGDGREIGKWLIRNGEEADAFVVSASMLAYGGLVPSRTGAQTLEGAREGIESLRRLKEAYPNKPIYVFDIIQRLTITSTGSESLETYENLRNWSILYDEVNNLGMKEREGKLRALEKKIPKAVMADFLKARKRNAEINSELIDMAKEGVVDYLILGQDDSYPHGIHRTEQSALASKAEKLGLQSKVAIFPAADQLGALLVARAENKLYKRSPSFYPEYGNPDNEGWVAAYEDIPFKEELAKQIEALGGKIADSPETANIRLMINNPSSSESRHEEEAGALAKKIADAIEAGESVAVAEIAQGHAEKVFAERLLAEADPLKLLSYAAWNAANNSAGISVAQASARKAFLEAESGKNPQRDLNAAKGQYEFLFQRFAKDYAYKGDVAIEAAQMAEKAGCDAWNMRENCETVRAFVKRETEIKSRKIFEEHFAGRTANAGRASAKIGDSVEFEFGIPWGRLFEIKLEPSFELKKL